MEYKYKEYLEKNGFSVFEKNLQAIKTEGYRFVFEDINSINNFLPVFIMKPARVNDQKDFESKCRGYALSFYDTQKNAINKYESLIKRKKYIYKQMGTHLARGTVDENDGTTDGIKQGGHFSLFEFIMTDFSKKFSICKALK